MCFHKYDLVFPIIFLSVLRCFVILSPGSKGEYRFPLNYREHYYQSCQFAPLQAEIIKLKHDLNLLGLTSNRIHHHKCFPYLVMSIEELLE